MCHVAPASNSPCQRSQTLRRDAALVNHPKEQATRPRVRLWVKSAADRTSGVGAKRTFERAVRSKSANNTPMLFTRLASLRDGRDVREVVYTKNLP
jgi:hypothetical protein